MKLPNCPECGSKYVLYKGEEDSIEKNVRKYSCQA